MMEKYAARAVKQRISRVLWEVWDPIGVNTHPEARDEYDSYVNPIFESLVAGDSDDAIAARLLSFVHERMELRRATLDDLRPTVRELRKAFEAANATS